MTAGRCCLQLFFQQVSHYHLERAYHHYQNAVNTMPIGLTAMFRLPALLLEFGKVLELYGAFEAAMEVYGRILSNFPNFRGYFDALYRSAIVGRHLAELMTTPKQREDTLNKCTDINQFLLEALPVTIDSVSARLEFGLFLHLLLDKLIFTFLRLSSYTSSSHRVMCCPVDFGFGSCISCCYTFAHWSYRQIRRHDSKHLGSTNRFSIIVDR